MSNGDIAAVNISIKNIHSCSFSAKEITKILVDVTKAGHQPEAYKKINE